MTVAELIELLKTFPPTMRVGRWVRGCAETEPLEPDYLNADSGELVIG